MVFQAGTKMAGEQLVASGGRVLAVTASAATVGEAQAAAYRAVDAIRFPDGFCRRDIGWREIAREAGTTGLIRSIGSRSGLEDNVGNNRVTP